MFIDEYRKSWSLRYLREAYADLSAAIKSADMNAVFHLTSVAIKKARLALYFVLGEPYFIESVLNRIISEGRVFPPDPLKEYLVKFHKLSQLRLKKRNYTSIAEITNDTKHFLDLAKEFIQLMLGEEVSVCIGSE